MVLETAGTPRQESVEMSRELLRRSPFSVRRLTRPEDGQDLLEYGLLASLIALFAVAAVRVLGDQISSVLWGAIANNF
jgi:Flp pilus assembly pilin Flp